MPKPKRPSSDRWLHERGLWNRGLRAVAGIDEVGRGPLAGPVIAAAAILDEDFDDPGITDSKALTPARRLELYSVLCQSARSWSIGIADPEEIDRYNILGATFLAMRRAIDGLTVAPDGVLVDGKFVIPEVTLPQRAIIGGDKQSLSVGAASILAKEVRDRIMEEYDATYPEYGFARHKGYATAEHTTALAKHGPTPIHRRSFAPLRLMQQNVLEL
jgi:ribonuclease HII